MDNGQNAMAWAIEEFGQARLGNVLRTRRLVRMAARIADAPAALVTAVFKTVGDRVGAYRFLENDQISVAAILASCAQAAIRRAGNDEWVYAPMDGSSLAMADWGGRRQLGAVGSYQQGGSGLKTMTSIAVRTDGTPLGLLDLQWWAREVVPDRNHTRHQRTVEQKETRYWLRAIQHVEEHFAQAETVARPWFQLDREGDFHELLNLMTHLSTSRVTVRAAHNRRTATGQSAYLWDVLHSQSAGGVYGLEVAPGPNRQTRRARMVVRWASVSLLLRNQRASSRAPRTPVSLWAVLALEEGTVPSGEKPLQWLLLTNAPVADFHAAVEVLFGYVQRWRIEEFHRAWKSQCAVEQNQLHDIRHIQLWATLLASVAMRIERLKYLARTQPDLPATEELNQEEIDAVIVLRQPSGYRRGDTPTISQAVRWIADLGGYIGPSNGPPGATVIGRGLQCVEVAVTTLRHLAVEKPD